MSPDYTGIFLNISGAESQFYGSCPPSPGELDYLDNKYPPPAHC